MHGDAAPQVDRFNSRDQHTIEGISLLIVIAVVAVLALLILWALIVQRR
jgi:competence protein ComGC